MEILENVETLDLGVYIKNYKTWVISDLHLGYEESLNKRGVLIPRTQFNEIYSRIEKVLKSNEIEVIVITGDLKHEFGAIHSTEWDNIISIINLFLKYAKKLVLIKGNHDVTLPFITKKKNIDLLPYYKFGYFICLHGDEIIDEIKNSKLIIMGHEHPAIGLKEKAKYEVFKCFLVGKFRNNTLIVLPSFNNLTIGTDVLRQKLLSPFLQDNLRNFSAFIVEDNKVLDFGKLKNLTNDIN